MAGKENRKERLNNMTIHKFLINFNYIWFSLIFFIKQLNMKKSFSFGLCLVSENFERKYKGKKKREKK